MPRPTIKIDTVLMARIANEDVCRTFPNGMKLFQHIAEKYNAEKNNMLFPVNVDFQLVGLRIKSGVVNINYPLPVGKRGKQPGTKLSPQHLDAMRIGRKTKLAVEKQIKEGLPANFSKPAQSLSSGMDKWQDNMRKNFAGKNTLLTGILSGKAKACIKGMCEMCMGGPKNRGPEDPALSAAIRDCRGLTCPLYIIRPFQKKVETV